jgi:hypothetical protein
MGAIASVKVCDLDVLAVAWTFADLAKPNKR